MAKYQFQWYELDQPLKLNVTDDFFFSVKDELEFFSGLYDPEKSRVLRCKILEISHQELGKISKIDTEGLDYEVHMVDGTVISINAEEEPGMVNDNKLQPTSWEFQVKLELLD